MKILPTLFALLSVALPGLASTTTAAGTSAGILEDFEAHATGPFSKLESSLGVLNKTSGTAKIQEDYPRSGRRYMAFVGNESTTLQVDIEASDGDRELSFWIERDNWLSRFSVSLPDGDGWKILKEIICTEGAGSYGNAVRLTIPAGTSAIQFQGLSVGEEGVIRIDDIGLRSQAPMRLVSCTTSQETLPILVGEAFNPLARIAVVTEGNQQPLQVKRVRIDMQGTTSFEGLSRVNLFWTDQGARVPIGNSRQFFGPHARFGDSTKPREGTLTFRGKRNLVEGENSFWISVTPGKTVDLHGLVDAGCLEIELSDGSCITPEIQHPPGAQRFGVSVRKKMAGGVHTHRIPGLVTTPKGTLIAVFDMRWNGPGDLPNSIDVGLSRSTDGGMTWQPNQVLMNMGDLEEWRGDGVGDPCVLVDPKTGALLVFAVWSHGDRGWNGSGPGLTADETGQLMMVRSDDDGLTWSEPRNLTEQVKRPEWSFLLQGPGRGIVMNDGTYVIPAQFQLSPEEGRLPHSTVMISRDKGETWTMGTGVLGNTTESAVVELENGELMLNMRDNRGGTRSIFTTEDLGQTWSEHPSSRSALVDPVCMGSLLHVGRELTGVADGRLLFSNPAVSKAPRRKISLRGSIDAGETWLDGSQIVLDSGLSAGYSCLTMVDATTIGVLYEGSRSQLTYQQVPLSAVFAPEESPSATPEER